MGEGREGVQRQACSAQKHLLLLCPQAKQRERKRCGGSLPASLPDSRGRGRRAVLRASAIPAQPRREPSNSCPATRHSDPEAFKPNSVSGRLKHHLTVEGAGLTRSLSPGPRLCPEARSPPDPLPSSWPHGPPGESRFSEKTKSSRARLCVTASTNSSMGRLLLVKPRSAAPGPALGLPTDGCVGSSWEPERPDSASPCGAS